MRIAIYTLGCKVNQAESACIEGDLRNNNHEIVKYTDNPDICIVNTCTVTAKSDYQSRQAIRRAAKSGARVIATGCYAQLRSGELSRINGLDLILGNSEKDRLSEFVNNLRLKTNKKNGPVCNQNAAVAINPPIGPLKSDTYYTNRSRAFLKIQDGCNFSCTYCTVPMARGKSRSLGQVDILKTVEKFHKDGFREIVLTGIHIGAYGLDIKPKSSLLEILKRITDDYRDIRFRLSSIEPQEFRKEFLSLIKDGSVCPHLHIPLQSGSDTILEAMNRGYNAGFYEELINSIVLTCPDISIGADVIVGFPGESEKDFNETASLIEKLPLSYLHVFPYSERPDTSASFMKGHIGDEIKRKRMDILLGTAKKKKNAYIEKQLGKYLNVIVENKTATPGFYRAVSDNYIKTLVRSNHQILGHTLRVKAISFSNGELLSVPSE